jgi:DNA-binding GntR family transcriptional regulator
MEPASVSVAGATQSSVARATRPASFSEYVCDVLREDIRSGALAPGSRITEASIMERTGVSRTPVREGLRRLEGEGLVVTHRSRGTFVTYRLTAEEAMLVYDVRLSLEPYLTRLAAERMSDDGLAYIRAVLDRFEAAIDGVDPREGGKLDAEFHLGIYEVSGSELLSVLRGYWSRLQLELSERVYTTELPRRFLREHRGIMEALEQGDGPMAAERMAAHISHGRTVMGRSLKEAHRAGRDGARAEVGR